KELLDSGSRSCLLATLDLASYYDDVSPAFLLAEDFISELKAKTQDAGISFDEPEYLRTTAGLLSSFDRYRAKAARLLGRRPLRGIPIGPLTSKVIANLALASLD